MATFKFLVGFFIVTLSCKVLAEEKVSHLSIDTLDAPCLAVCQDDWDGLGLDDELSLDNIDIADIDDIPDKELTWHDYVRLFIAGAQYQASKAKKNIITGAQKTKEHLQMHKKAYASGVVLSALVSACIYYALHVKNND